MLRWRLFGLVLYCFGSEFIEKLEVIECLVSGRSLCSINEICCPWVTLHVICCSFLFLIVLIIVLNELHWWSLLLWVIRDALYQLFICLIIINHLPMRRILSIIRKVTYSSMIWVEMNLGWPCGAVANQITWSGVSLVTVNRINGSRLVFHSRWHKHIGNCKPLLRHSTLWTGWFLLATWGTLTKSWKSERVACLGWSWGCTARAFLNLRSASSSWSFECKLVDEFFYLWEFLSIEKLSSLVLIRLETLDHSLWEAFVVCIR